MDTVKALDDIDHRRRRFFGAAAMALAAAQLGLIGKARAQGKPLPTVKPGTNTSFTSLKQIYAGLLNIGYAEAGPAKGPAVLLLHGTTGTSKNFFAPNYANELYGEGQPLDARKFFIIVPDGIGLGGSSKPSDGLHAKFPKYGYLDMVEAQYKLLTEGLHVSHLKLILGTSMGGMQTWLWGEQHPDFMDALMPVASLRIIFSAISA